MAKNLSGEDRNEPERSLADSLDHLSQPKDSTVAAGGGLVLRRAPDKLWVDRCGVRRVEQEQGASLRELMQRAQVTSLRELGRQAQVSRWSIDLLRRGRVRQLRLDQLLGLSRALKLSVSELLNRFEPQAAGEATAWPAEYQRLQAQLHSQQQVLEQQFRAQTLQALESLLLQWPTAAHAARQNPQLPAKNLLPVLRPLEQLLTDWGVEPIGEVGTEVAFDPQQHQAETHCVPGERVRVRYVGYRQGETLLYRARVSPV